MVRRFIWSACALAVLLFVCLEVNWKSVILTLTPSTNRINAAAARLHFIALHTAIASLAAAHRLCPLHTAPGCTETRMLSRRRVLPHIALLYTLRCTYLHNNDSSPILA